MANVTDKRIDSFTGEYRFLSNFFPTEVTYQGDIYNSVEQAYQASKTNDLGERARIRGEKSPGKAKRLGRRVTLRPDWEQVKLQVMHELVLQKFQDKVLRAELLTTGDLELIENNWWNDYFWGVCRGTGENHLGKILMKVRDQLRQKGITG